MKIGQWRRYGQTFVANFLGPPCTYCWYIFSMCNFLNNQNNGKEIWGKSE